MPDRSQITSNALGLVGAAAGGAVGYFAFFWLVSQGYYGMILPGGLLGLGCGLLARHRSIPRGVVCGLAAVLLGLFTEWKYAPFQSDGSFLYLLTNAQRLPSVTLLMIGVGGLIAFWMGRDGGFSVQRVKGPAEL